MHPRLIASNGRVAHTSLKGQVQAERFVSGEPHQIAVSVASLRRQPHGALDCQLLFGTKFLVLEQMSGWSFGQSLGDGYVGYIRNMHLTGVQPATHRVTALASHVYKAPDMKSGADNQLSFGSTLTVTGNSNGFSELIDGGFIPGQHVGLVDHHLPDFVSVFERFTGVPYLWGGNSAWGVDCSGLLQLALNAAGQECPRDSDMQEIGLGYPLAQEEPMLRGDVVFWQGHVGVMRDSETLIHANAHHMAVASEPLASASARIEQNDGGAVTSIRRL
jgi:cell wall-associated NlpC family hydrolase